MTGTNYVLQRPEGLNYTHLRAMLHECWALMDVAPEDRFEIDVRFAVPTYNAPALANYIVSQFSPEIINQAHDLVSPKYQNGKRKGRPVGSLNKSTLQKLADGVADLSLPDYVSKAEFAKLSAEVAEIREWLEEYITKPGAKDAA